MGGGGYACTHVHRYVVDAFVLCVHGQEESPIETAQQASTSACVLTVYINTISPIYSRLCVLTSSSLDTDRHVILGNHRDAWVFGAVDPNSATAVLMEMARTLSILRKNSG